MDVWAEIQKYKDYTVSMRRYFHRHPELGWNEFHTAEVIRRELGSFGIPYVTVGETGTVGVLAGRPGLPVIGLRCDIDALPIEEQCESDYRSEVPGRMHACGHDSHIAMLLTAARILAEHRNELDCTVKFFFQPAEEVATGKKSGAKDLLASGLADDLTTVCGLHIFPMLDTGKISVEAGPRFTAAAILKLAITGKSGHGAMPQHSIDPIYVACKVVDALQSIASRETDPREAVVVSICSFRCGNASNIIDETAYLQGTIRTFSPELQEKLPGMIERIVAGTCSAYRATYELDIDNNYPVTINDACCADLARQAVVELCGEEAVGEYPKTPGGEDFSYFLQRSPGVYAFVGCRNEEKDCVYPLHHRKFDIDEDGMQYGAGFLVQYTLKAQQAFAQA